MTITRIPESEAGFQRAVIDLARLRGWMVFHARPAQTRSGRWATHMQGDPGFPDLVLCRRERVIFAELKTQKGKATAAQRRWLDELGQWPLDGGLGSYRVYLWRPSSWNEIEEELK